MQVSIQQRIVWSMASRLSHRDAGSNRTMHGHDWEAWFTVERIDGSLPQDTGWILDFDAIKRELEIWVSENLARNVVLQDSDSGLLNAFEADPLATAKPFRMPQHPTAENIALMLLRMANRRLRPLGVWCSEVVVSPTADSRARVTIGSYEEAESL